MAREAVGAGSGAGAPARACLDRRSGKHQACGIAVLEQMHRAPWLRTAEPREGGKGNGEAAGGRQRCTRQLGEAAGIPTAVRRHGLS
eukprot:scaffold78536_cov19-Tisochrysis_lutea.AAC.4